MTTNSARQFSNGDGAGDQANETAAATDHNGNSGDGAVVAAAGLAGLMEPRLFATMQRNLAANSDLFRQFQVKRLPSISTNIVFQE